MMAIVSGRLSARPKEVKLEAVSPSPCRRMRMLCAEVDDEVEVDTGGGVVSCEPGYDITTVAFPGKSSAIGIFGDIFD